MKTACRYKNAANSGFSEELLPLYTPYVVSTSSLEAVGDIVLFRDMSACLLTIEKELEVFETSDDFLAYLIRLIQDKPYLEGPLLKRLEKLSQVL